MKILPLHISPKTKAVSFFLLGTILKQIIVLFSKRLNSLAALIKIFRGFYLGYAIARNSTAPLSMSISSTAVSG